MAAIRRVLKHLSVETAGSRRICHRNRRKHSVPKGHVCLVIQEDGLGSKNYCTICAEPILRQAQEDLDHLLGRLEVSTGDSS